MRTIILILFYQLILFNCQSQKIEIIDHSSEDRLNYYLANIYLDRSSQHSLYNDGLNATILPFADTKRTKIESFKDGHEVMVSYLISITADGEYINSSLFEIGPFINPKIISVTPLKYPNFNLEVQDGKFDKRQTVKYEIKPKKL
ncbi:hypothetical protein [Ekhidna lutea]|nr:hypothetical protein [Ekhidna lutea]